MGMIYEPIKDWNIILATLHDGKEQTVYTFKHIDEFKRHLYTFVTHGEAIGYFKKRKHPVTDMPFFSAELSFEWWDQCVYCKKDFNSAKDFAEFLIEYPKLGRAIGAIKANE